MLNASSISKKLGLSADSVANIYLIGSRLYGNYQDGKSDFDLIVVLKDGNDSDGIQEIQRGNLDAMVMSSCQFQSRLNEFKFKELLCHFAPEENKLKEEIRFKFSLTNSCLHKLYTKATDLLAKDWHRVEKYVQCGNLERAKKTFLCQARQLLIYQQLVHFYNGDEDVDDTARVFAPEFKEANDWFYELTQVQYADEETLTEWKSRIDNLLRALRMSCGV